MNVTNNTTDSEGVDTSLVAEIVWSMVIFVIGTPLNIYTLYRQLKQIRATAVGEHKMMLLKLSLQLTISNLLTILCCGGRAVWLYTWVWYGGDVLCKLFNFLRSLSLHLWSNMVACIGLDMLFCIKAPLRAYTMGQRRLNVLIVTAWLLAIAFAVPTLFLKGTVEIPSSYAPAQFGGKEQCYFLYHHVKHVGMLTSLVDLISVFYVPLAVICASYVAIGVIFHRSLKTREKLSEKRNVSLKDKKRQLRVSRREKREDKKRYRLLISTIAIVGTYVLTWLPFQVISIFRLFCKGDSDCINSISQMEWLEAVMLGSTIINPFLYRFNQGGNSARRNTNYSRATCYSTRRTQGASSLRAPPRATLFPSSENHDGNSDVLLNSPNVSEARYNDTVGFTTSTLQTPTPHRNKSNSTPTIGPLVYKVATKKINVSADQLSFSDCIDHV